MRNPHFMVAIAWTLVFCFAATVGDGIVRYITLQGFPSGEVLFIRSFLGILLLLPLVIKRRLLHNIPRKTLKLYGARGVFAFSAIALWFYILKKTDFTTLIAVGFTAPLFTTVLSIVLLGEKPNFIKIVALIIGFSGAMVVINPTSIGFNGYLLLGVVSALLWAVSLIVTKQLSNKESPVAVVFFFTLVLTPLSFLLAFPVWQWPTIEEWWLILLFTAIATLGQIALVRACSYADLTTLMPFEFSQLIFAALFATIVFGDTVMLNTFLGGAIILGSGYIIIRSERKKHRQEELQIIP